MPLQKNVVDGNAANYVPVLRAGIDISLVGKAMQMSKQFFILLRQNRTGAKGSVSSFVIIEDAHFETPNDCLQPPALGRSPARQG